MPDICRGDHCSSMMSCLSLHTNSGARAALRVERLRRSIALSCALNPIYLPDGVLLRLNSRESVDWLIPTIRAISFLGHFLWSKAKICDLCSEVSCLYIRNTKIINLRESSRGDSFLYCRYRSSGLRAPAARPPHGVFHGLDPMKKRMICCTSILKVRATKLYDILSPIVEVMFALLDFTIGSPTRARIRASAVFRFLPSPLHLTLLKS